MAVLELVLTAVVTAVYSAVLLRREPYCRIAPSSPPTVSGWWLPAGAAIGFGALLLIPMALSSNGWASGHGEARLVTLLHYRAPYALIIAVVLAVTAAGAALLIGRTSRDEREHDRAANARHQREERTRRRREDRAAARRGRGGTRAEASE